MRFLKSFATVRPAAGLMAGAFVLATALSAWAFPPAPYHTIYGLIRDEYGNPLMSSDAVVTLTTTTGVQVSTTVVPNLAPGMNYRMLVPIDAGLTAAAYKPTALRPFVGIRMTVVQGGVSYCPMEVKANFSNLGQPAQSTRMDMTLGVDTIGDGLPDAWKYLMIEMGYGETLADIRPQDDSDGDGISNMDEYLAGTYAFDPTDGFRLDIVGMQADGKPLLEFMAITGRSYTLLGSTDLKAWSAMKFRVPAEGATPALRSCYSASDVRKLRIAAEVAAGQKAVFFKAMVQ